MAEKNMNSSAHRANSARSNEQASAASERTHTPASTYRSFVKRSHARKQARKRARRMNTDTGQTYISAQFANPAKKKADAVFRLFLAFMLATTMVILPTPMASAETSDPAAQTQSADSGNSGNSDNAGGDSATGSQTPSGSEQQGGRIYPRDNRANQLILAPVQILVRLVLDLVPRQVFLMTSTHPIPKQTPAQPQQTPIPTNLLLKASW